MPTYEYECTHCRHRFDRFQSMIDAPVKRCPKCRHKVNRLPGIGAGIIFKGSGFYETDYRSESYTKKAKEEKSAASPKKDESKSETKSKTGEGEKSKNSGSTK